MRRGGAGAMLGLCGALLLSGCAAQSVQQASYNLAGPEEIDAKTTAGLPADLSTVSNLDRLIRKYADVYDVPESLIRRVIRRESNYNPKARNGRYWGLMQIDYRTARGMGYDGSAKGLLDAETNLIYAVKYLKGAYVVANGNEGRAVRYYASGYYYVAKRKGLLAEAGLQ